MKKSLISMVLFLASSIGTQLVAQEYCPANDHVSEVCGTLTVTDYMGVPGTTPKFWIVSGDRWIRLGYYEGGWGQLAMAAYMRVDACLYSDQEIIEDTIDIAEFCR